MASAVPISQKEREDRLQKVIERGGLWFRADCHVSVEALVQCCT